MRPGFLVASLFLFAVFGYVSSAAGADYLADAERWIAKGDLKAAEIQLKNAVKADADNMEARYRLGSLQFRLGDAVGAEKEGKIARTLGYDPERVVPLIVQAYLAQGKFRQVLQEFSATEGGAERQGAVLVAHGYAHFGLGKLDEALASFQQAQQLTPGLVEPLVGAAKILLAKGDLTGADAALAGAGKIDAKSPDLLLTQAQLLRAKGDAPGAITALDTALAVSPSFAAARLERAALLVSQGKDEQAKDDIESSLKANPNSVQAIYLQAVVFARAKQYKEADANLQKVSGAIAALPRGYYLLAIVKYNLREFAQARDAAMRFNARDPKDVAGQKLLARLEAETGQLDHAIEILSNLISVGDADAESYDLLGRAFARAGKADQALQAFEQAVTLAPQSAGLRMRLAGTRLRAGDADTAIEDLERSLELEPSNTAAGETLVITELRSGRFEAAAEAAEKLATVQLDSPAARNLVGLVKLARLDLDGAHRVFADVVKAHPDFIPGRLNLARVDDLQGHPDQAEAELTNILAKKPAEIEALRMVVGLLRARERPRAIAAIENAQQAASGRADTLAALVDLYIDLGEKDRALTLAQTESGENDRRNVPLITARARAEVVAGLKKDAIATFRRLAAIYPQSIAPPYQIANLLLSMGDFAEARKMTEEALAAHPGTPELIADLVAIELKSSGVDAAIATAERLRREQPSLPMMPMLIGDLYMTAQQMDKAAAAYENEFRASPTTQLALHLAAAKAAEKKMDEATGILQQWLSEHPDEVQVAFVLASYDLRLQQFDEARTLLEGVVAKRPTDVVALNNLAWFYQQRRDSRARPLAERAYLLAPAMAQTSDTLGWIMVEQGEARTGLELLRKASAAASVNPAISYHLAVALKETGHRDEAAQLLTSLISSTANFDDKPAAEKLLAEISHK
jgi:putative PEP-CTERM system TPR-repeat lipoprotein